MDYLSKIEKHHEERLASLNKGLEDEPQIFELRKRLGAIFEELTKEIQPIYDWVGVNFEFRFSTVEEAREFTDKLLNKLWIEKAEKSFEGWREKPMWFYLIDVEGQRIKIEPAEPSSDCRAVPKLSSSVHWVCEKIEE